MIEATPLSDHVSLTIDSTEARQTPPPASRRFAEALEDGVDRLVHEAGDAASSLPGGTLVAAATRDVPVVSDPALGAGGERPEGPGGAEQAGGDGGSDVDAYWRMQQESQEFNLQFLQLQEGLSQENRRFTALSNVLKARHDTTKAVIQNIR